MRKASTPPSLTQRNNPLLHLRRDVSCEVRIVGLALQRLSRETPSSPERVEVKVCVASLDELYNLGDVVDDFEEHTG